MPKLCPNISFPHQQDFFPIRSVTKSSTSRFSHENLVEKFKIFGQDFVPIRTALIVVKFPFRGFSGDDFRNSFTMCTRFNSPRGYLKMTRGTPINFFLWKTHGNTVFHVLPSRGFVFRNPSIICSIFSSEDTSKSSSRRGSIYNL